MKKKKKKLKKKQDEMIKEIDSLHNSIDGINERNKKIEKNLKIDKTNKKEMNISREIVNYFVQNSKDLNNFRIDGIFIFLSYKTILHLAYESDSTEIATYIIAWGKIDIKSKTVFNFFVFLITFHINSIS